MLSKSKNNAATYTVCSVSDAGNMIPGNTPNVTGNTNFKGTFTVSCTIADSSMEVFQHWH